MVTKMRRKAGLYIHIPFCVRKCNYCSFLSFACNDLLDMDSMHQAGRQPSEQTRAGCDAKFRASYADALIREIKMRANQAMFESTEEGSLAQDMRQMGKPMLDTVYFGGGTPSLMDVKDIEIILETIRESFELKEGAEITLEANPGTLAGDCIQAGAVDISSNFDTELSSDYSSDNTIENRIKRRLEEYRRIGINRLSMGVQSLDDDSLRFIGRIHSAKDVIRDYRLAREAGFSNINLDLIFSIPGERAENALADAARLISLDPPPEHISCYSLQIEEGTPLCEMIESNNLKEVSDEEDRRTYHEMCKFLTESGYEHYEISNFARQIKPLQIESERSKLRSEHNSLYWNMSDYIAAGLGASGFVGGRRYRNVTSFEDYFDMIDRGMLPENPEEEHINTPFDNISEAVFTGLRRREGISYREAIEAYKSSSGVDTGRRGGEAFRRERRFAREAMGDEASQSWNEAITGSEEAREFWEIYSDAFEEALEYSRRGLLIIDDRGLRLSEEGIDISNAIMSLFV